MAPVPESGHAWFPAVRTRVFVDFVVVPQVGDGDGDVLKPHSNSQVLTVIAGGTDGSIPVLD